MVIDWQCLPQVQERTVMGQRVTPLPSLHRALSLVLLGAGAERVCALSPLASNVFITAHCAGCCVNAAGDHKDLEDIAPSLPPIT